MRDAFNRYFGRYPETWLSLSVSNSDVVAQSVGYWHSGQLEVTQNSRREKYIAGNYYDDEELNTISPVYGYAMYVLELSLPRIAIIENKGLFKPPPTVSQNGYKVGNLVFNSLDTESLVFFHVTPEHIVKVVSVKDRPPKGRPL